MSAFAPPLRFAVSSGDLPFSLLHYMLPQVTIRARTNDEIHAAVLQRTGATHVIPEPAPIGATIAELVL